MVRKNSKLPDDVRYEHFAALSRHADDRAVYASKDRLTGRDVIVKTSAVTLAAQEARALLAVPSGIVPRLLDAYWHPTDGLHLILEELAGATLLEAAPDLDRAEIPSLVACIAQHLGALHRAGLTHCDIKPANILIRAHAGRPDVRLLDLGFAQSHSLDGAQERGGTPPFMSPELARGWAIDGRADQYSLGMTLVGLFPDIAEDARWSTILTRLCEAVPARRYPTMLAVRDQITAEFALDSRIAVPPTFGAGSLRGREDERQALLARIHSTADLHLILAARPGTGLTRFLLELLLDVAADAGPAMRLLDLADLRAVAGERIASFLQDSRVTGGILVVGAPDPSPRLRAIERQWGRALCEELTTPRWARRRLPPIDAPATAEIVTESLGAGGAAAEALGAALHEETEGDLRAASHGFATVVARCGSEEGLAWTLDDDQLRRRLAAWESPVCEPSFASVSAECQESLQVFAHAGSALPRTVAESLLEHFSSPRSLAELLDEGYLQPEGGDRVAMITARLAREVNTLEGDRAQVVDRWLHENWAPDPTRPAETLRACARARRLGDGAVERTHLSAALTHAHRVRQWDALRQFYLYPDARAEEWSLELAHRRVAALRTILEDEWSTGRLLFVLAEGLRPVRPDLTHQLFEEVVAIEDDPASRDALGLILDRSVSRSAWEEYDHWLDVNTERTARGHGVHPGILGFCDARRALSEGKVDAGIARAAGAAQALLGSGSPFEGLTLQLLAFLKLSSDPAEGLATMRAAYDAAQDQDLKAQMCKNLALMHSQRGDFRAAAECADEGIRNLQGGISPGRTASLRLERAAAWANLGNLDAAMREGRTLLTLTVVRQVRSYEVTARLLLAYCHLYHHTSRRALAHAARAWQMSAQGCFPGLEGYCLRLLVDILLDLEAWDAVAAVAEDLQLTKVGANPADVTSAARAAALVSQARGDLEGAAKQLEVVADKARSLNQPEATARYLHHMGILQLALGNAARAREYLETERALLAGTGYHYYRGRAELVLSRAAWLLEDEEGARAALDEAIAQAEGAQCQGLLAQCLLTRAERELAE